MNCSVVVASSRLTSAAINFDLQNITCSDGQPGFDAGYQRVQIVTRHRGRVHPGPVAHF